MSTAQSVISQEIITKFLQDHLITPAQELKAIIDLIGSSSQLTVNTLLSAFSGNVHIGYSDLKNFNINELEVSRPSSRIMTKLHLKTWQALYGLMQEHLSPAAVSHYYDRYYHNDNLLKERGCPSVETITKLLSEFSEIEAAGQDLLAAKEDIKHLIGDELTDKVKLKTGTLEERALIIAKLVNIRDRLANSCQPFHYNKTEVHSVESIVEKIKTLKESGSSEETEIANKCLVKIYNNGNIDLKLNRGFARSAFSHTL